MFTAYYHAKSAPRFYFIALLALMAGIFYTIWPGATLRAQETVLGELKAPRRLSTEVLKSAVPLGASEKNVDRLHRGLAELDDGRYDEAIRTWEQLPLPCENEVWRHLALAVANLNSGRLANAADQLELAATYDAENAAVHYFRGVLKMAFAENAREYSDALRRPLVPRTNPQLVSYVDGGVPELDLPRSSLVMPGEKSRSRYELEAMNEFELALELAARLNVGETLLPIDWVVFVPHPIPDVQAPPTVEDLLTVLGADNFVGKAHGLLTYLYVDHGRPDEADFHCDEAYASGIAVPYGYRLIGEQYQELGRSTDAYRAYMKAVKEGDGMARPFAEALQKESAL